MKTYYVVIPTLWAGVGFSIRILVSTNATLLCLAQDIIPKVVLSRDRYI